MNDDELDGNGAESPKGKTSGGSKFSPEDLDAITTAVMQSKPMMEVMSLVAEIKSVIEGEGDEHTDDGGDFVEESVFHTIPDPDNEPNDSCMSTFFSQVGVIGFILGNDFLAYLRSKADKTNSNLTEQLNSDSALPKPFDWKSKNFEVLSQLFNTLALSESQAEMILLGVSLILILRSNL